LTEALARSVASPALEVRGLTVHYGHVEVLHDLSLKLDRGVLGIVGRNGMGKTTLCKAIMGLARPTRGQIFAYGAEISALAPNRIVHAAVAYVPQGRRVWPSLTVDEHLRLAFIGDRNSAWTRERVYATFPRLAERRGNFGSQLSGGEQQMLAIGRALLANPRLLIMDEPTEGLAPVIVDRVCEMLKRLAEDGGMSTLLIEQNLGVALDVASDVAILVHGRIAREMPARELAADEGLQLRLLGVGRDEDEAPVAVAPEPVAEVRYIQIERRHGEGAAPSYTFAGGAQPAYSATAIPTAYSADNPIPRAAETPRPSAPPAPYRRDPEPVRGPEVGHVPVAAMTGRSAYVVGTFDTKRSELAFLANSLKRLGVKTVTVDLATSGKPSPADIGPAEVAKHHPGGEAAVFTGDRGASVTAMAEAFSRFIRGRRDLGGIISAGGSGGTALATTGMRALPIGIPKFMVSTVASGDVSRYVGPSDIIMMYSVTDVQGINSISEQVLSNAAHALAGMIAHQRREDQRASTKPAIGLTMFGLTTTCVQAVTAALRERYDCLVFHATGTGGQSMEKLVDSHLLTGVIDVTTTEVADYIVGGVFSAGPDRFGAMSRVAVPYVGSCGALDMVNFYARDTVPARFDGRKFYIHNPNVTLMRTTPEENEAMGMFIAERLNRMQGPVRFLIPEGGLSGIDAPGQPFHDPAANRALFSTIERMFVQNARRRLIKLPYHINDQAFADALVKSFREIAGEAQGMASERLGAWRA
jgi:uncharacterized protein (UPF0261 family)/ABC-type branched-subunit amino acid transport system ATPase component